MTLKIEPIVMWFTIFCLSVATLAQIPKAIEREQEFNDNLKLKRCERVYINGYCDK
jgi:hypothetical protein